MGSERIALGSWNSGGWAFSDRLLNRFFRLHQCSFHNFYCSNGLVEVFECPEHQPRKMKKSCDTLSERLSEALRRTGSTERCWPPRTTRLLFKDDGSHAGWRQGSQSVEHASPTAQSCGEGRVWGATATLVPRKSARGGCDRCG